MRVLPFEAPVVSTPVKHRCDFLAVQWFLPTSLDAEKRKDLWRLAADRIDRLAHSPRAPLWTLSLAWPAQIPASPPFLQLGLPRELLEKPFPQGCKARATESPQTL